MKILSRIAIAFFILNVLVAQDDDFVFINGAKIQLQESDKISFKIKSPDREAARIQVLAAETDFESIEELSSVPGFYVAKIKPGKDKKALRNRLKDDPKIKMAVPSFKCGLKDAIAHDVMLIQFGAGVTKTQVDNLCMEYKLSVSWQSAITQGLYALKLSDSTALPLLKMCNTIYQQLPCEWSKPSFILPFELFGNPNDVYFNSQYYLHNSNDADIDMPEAWDITAGSSSITVAVIDGGVSEHEDLPLSRIRKETTPVHYPIDPGAVGNEAHGQACAGIIAASRNNTSGMAGIAPNCKILPVRVFNERGSDVNNLETIWIASIEYAYTYADVISLSVGLTTSNPAFYISLRDAFNRALTQGRGGKGCVIVAAAGNENTAVGFPANMPGVIAVGASTQTNTRQPYSSFGPELSLVAPSGPIFTNISSTEECSKFEFHETLYLGNGNVISLDIAGSQGYNPGYYRISVLPITGMNIRADHWTGPIIIRAVLVVHPQPVLRYPALPL